MNIDRELQRLQERVARISIAKSPPTLTMGMGRGEEPFPELDEWTLGVRIENKRTH